MPRYVASLLVAGGLLALFAARPSSHVATDRAREVTRVRAHFDSVLRELDAHDITRLSQPQRAQRAMLVATLRNYRDQGDFPRNYDFPGRSVPYFVDRKNGVRCAVAHLLESTGRTDIVQRVSAANNNVHVRQLAGDSAFTTWLRTSGLTLDDAAGIQPSYYGEDRKRDRDHYGMMSAFTLTASLGTTVANLTANDDGRSRLMSVLGVMTGAAALGFGTLGVVSEDAPTSLAWTNSVVGSAGMIVGVRGLLRRQRAIAAVADVNEQGSTPSRADVRAIVTPTFSLTGQRSAGVLFQLQF